MAAGCVQTEARFETTLPADAAQAAFVDLERGDLIYTGVPQTEVFDLQIASWGRGGTRAQADRRAAKNEWSAQITGMLFDVQGRSPAAHAGVDADITGPLDMDVDALLLDGTARLHDVQGSHILTANRIETTSVTGELDLVATLIGVDAEVFPHAGATIRIDAVGDVVLRLPYGLEYDLVALTDPDWGAQVFDLGFDSLFFAPDYVSAQTGSGAIRVEVFLTGGTFFLWEALPAQ